MELFQKFLNRVGRTYGQVDKNIFGGLLPGGAATPLGAAFQRSGIPKNEQPSDFVRRKAALVDATATGLAKAQPFVERSIKAAPPFVQQAISKGLNTAPFSVNLFGRYYTGIGADGLQIPAELTKEIGNTINNPAYQKDIYNASIKEEKNLSQMLNSPGAAGMQLPFMRTLANNNLAEVRSRLRRMDTGDIPYSAYGTSSSNNPLTSAETSLGRVWFSPSQNGYTANEKYDFVYGAADRKTPIGPGMPTIDPSQVAALTAVTGMPIPGGNAAPAAAHPLTFFGRSVVMKMPDKSFSYPINIR